jgi:hydroxyacylglutathione hydrolase
MNITGLSAGRFQNPVIMKLNIQQFRYSSDNLGYLVYGAKSTIAIDGGAVDDILSFIRSRHLDLKYVANTHSHMDHTIGNHTLLARTKAVFFDFDTLLKKGNLDLDGESIRVFHTPGHTQDCLCFYFDSILISGDTLFNGKVGRCFIGDVDAFFQSIQKIIRLPGETNVYAGHDYVEEYMEFAKRLEPDNLNIDPYLKNYDPNHVTARLADEVKVDPFLRFNDEKIITILKDKGLPFKTELDRWRSLMSLM